MESELACIAKEKSVEMTGAVDDLAEWSRDGLIIGNKRFEIRPRIWM